MTIEDIKNKIEDLEKTRAESSKRITDFKTETRDRINELSEEIRSSGDPYIIARKTRERAALFEDLELIDKQKAPQLMNISEYGEIKATLNAEIEELKAERSAAILAAIEQIEDTIDDYENEAEALENLKTRAQRLALKMCVSSDSKYFDFSMLDNSHPGASRYVNTYFGIKADRSKNRIWFK